MIPHNLALSRSQCSGGPSNGRYSHCLGCRQAHLEPVHPGRVSGTALPTAPRYRARLWYWDFFVVTKIREVMAKPEQTGKVASVEEVIRWQRVLLEIGGRLAAATEPGGLIVLHQELGWGRLRHLFDGVEPVVVRVNIWNQIVELQKRPDTWVAMGHKWPGAL